MGVIRRHRRNRVALVKRLFRSQAVIAQEFGVDHRPLAQIDHPAARLRKVCGSNHSHYSRHCLGPRSVDALDPGVSVRAPQYFGVQQARQPKIGAILRAARNLVGSVVSYRPAADYSVSIGCG